jgi:sporulation integral membrane protein YlbJ
MSTRPSISGSRSYTVALGTMAAVLVIVIILFPDAAFQSSLQGLNLWWKLVFPALMPFLILTELLIGFGALQAIGVLMEPLMRLWFRLPGVGGWALASGFLVGFPAGAKITASLREKKLISRLEAQRLVSLSHLCSPIFLVTVVGVGFLHNAQLGFLLAVVHYLSAFTTGLIISRKKSELRKESISDLPVSEDTQSEYVSIEQSSPSLWARSIRTMRQAYLHDGRAFGMLLGDAVTSSVQTLMLIGGYMMIYSVIVNVLTMSGITEVLQALSTGMLNLMHLGTDMAPRLLEGVFEIHLGTYSISQAQDAPLVWQLAMLSALLGWGGLSAHAQVNGLTQKTDIRYMPFLLARGLHAVLAFLCTVVLWNPLQRLFQAARPSFSQLQDAGSFHTLNLVGSVANFQAWAYWQPMLLAWILTLTLMILMSLLLLRFHKHA